MHKYEPPTHIRRVCDPIRYRRWLRRAAARHLKRDRLRGNTTGTPEHYREAIHLAVCRSSEVDPFTGDKLDWSLICTYDNAESAAARRNYKAKFALLPTVDHVGDGVGAANFTITSWKVNDAKGDLADVDFIAMCTKVSQQRGQGPAASTN